MVVVMGLEDVKLLSESGIADALKVAVEADCAETLGGESDDGSSVRVCVLQPGVDDCLAILQGSGGWLEWVQMVALSDGSTAYKACQMEDNDCFTFYWVPVGVDSVLDGWLSERCEE